jgi:DNA-binding MarR family transcriptional regulator
VHPGRQCHADYTDGSRNELLALHSLPMSELSELPEETRIEAVRALARASRAMERSSGELSMAHYRILSAVAAGEERASRVARRLALGRPTVSAAVEVLAQRGLLERHSVTEDGRASALWLTPEGVRVLAAVEAAMLERLERFAVATKTPAEIFTALQVLGCGIDAVLGGARS